MVYIKLYNTVTEEIRILNPRIGFDEMIVFVQKNFNISSPVFKFKDEEGEVVTFSTNEELVFLKELAEGQGWNKMKINVESSKKESCDQNNFNRPSEENERREPIDFLNLIEQNAPAFFSSLGIECTTYREEVEVPIGTKSESAYESKTDEFGPTVNIDLKLVSFANEPKLKVSEPNVPICGKKLMTEECSFKSSFECAPKEFDETSDLKNEESEDDVSDNEENTETNELEKEILKELNEVEITKSELPQQEQQEVPKPVFGFQPVPQRQQGLFPFGQQSAPQSPFFCPQLVPQGLPRPFPCPQPVPQGLSPFIQHSEQQQQQGLQFPRQQGLQFPRQQGLQFPQQQVTMDQFSPVQPIRSTPSAPFAIPQTFQYEFQLDKIYQMGFTDVEKVKKCLIACKGEIEDTINMVLG